MIIIMTDIITFFVIVLIFFIYVSKSDVRPDWRCSRCVVTHIIMTAGDAEDAS